MKIIKNLIPILLLVCTFTSCEKSELMTYKEKENIYFHESILPNDYGGKDTASIPFAYLPVGLTDTTLSIKVQISGSPSSKDRNFKVGIDPSSTAIAGTHYEAIPEAFPLLADSIYGYIKIKILRSPDLLANIVSLSITLLPNEDFDTRLQYRILNASTGQGLHMDEYKIVVSDILTKPLRWMENYFGTYSRKKCLLICEVTGITPRFLNGEPDAAGKTVSPNDLIFFGLFTQRYLNEQKELGNVILDEDGSTMIMGLSSQ